MIYHCHGKYFLKLLQRSIAPEGTIKTNELQAEYLLAGRIMKRDSFETPLKCSLQSAHLEAIGNLSD